jgi:dienelactone hydrolase
MRRASVVVAPAAAAVVVAAGVAGAASGGSTSRGSDPPPSLLPGQHPYSSTIRVGGDGRTEVVRVGYLLYAPAAYGQEPGRRWPLIVFLHGGGERGDDPLLLTAQPLPQTLARAANFPAIVFSPQLPLRFTFWSQMIEPVDALLRRLEARYRVDPRRVYLTGLSTGGFGTWEYALRHPQRFAALVPVAGGYLQGSSAVPRRICALRTTPIWAFHGADDTVVYPYQTEVLVRALRRCGSRVVRFTLYPGVDHSGSWHRAYRDPALWKWLFAQRRRNGGASLQATRRTLGEQGAVQGTAPEVTLRARGLGAPAPRRCVARIEPARMKTKPTPMPAVRGSPSNPTPRAAAIAGLT